MKKFSEMIYRDRHGYSFNCPGCNTCHMVLTDEGSPKWTFNGDVNNPTVSPSIRVKYYDNKLAKNMVCHSFIKDGKIQFLNDCTHNLSGQTVEIPDW